MQKILIFSIWNGGPGSVLVASTDSVYVRLGKKVNQMKGFSLDANVVWLCNSCDLSNS
jgi:hypothetical protein